MSRREVTGRLVVGLHRTGPRASRGRPQHGHRPWTVEEDETIMTFQPGETPAIAARIGRSLKAVRERRRRIRNGSTVSGGQLKRGPRPFGIPREGIIDVRRAGLPEGGRTGPRRSAGGSCSYSRLTGRCTAWGRRGRAMRATWSRTADVVLLLAAWPTHAGAEGRTGERHQRRAGTAGMLADESSGRGYTGPWRGVMASGSGCGWQRRSSGWRRGHRDASPGSLTHHQRPARRHRFCTHRAGAVLLSAKRASSLPAGGV